MKKFLLTLATLFGLGMTASAGIANFTFSENGYENSEDVTEVVSAPITINFDQGDGLNAPKYYTSGTAIRAYYGNTITVTSSSEVITQIVINFGSGDGNNIITANTGSYENGIWSGEASTVTFNIGLNLDDKTSGNRRLAGFEVTYGETATPPVVTPKPEVPTGVITVAQALQYLNDGGEAATVQVKGYITKVTSFNSKYYSITYYIGDTADAPDAETLQVYSGKGLNGADFSSQDDLAVGALVTVEGSLFLYNGNTPEINQNSKILSYLGPNGETEPGSPEVDTPQFTVAEAIAWLEAGNEGKATVTGYVTSIDEIDTGSYGNATYYLGDAVDATTTLEVYRGYGLDGAKFTDENQLLVGAFVKVSGNLITFTDGTLEFTSGSKILEYTAPAGGENPPTEEQPTTPPTPEDGQPVTFDFTQFTYGIEGQVAGENNDNFITTIPAVMTYGDVTITLNATNEEGNKWRFWNDGLRAYTAGAPYFTVATTNNENITAITWTLKNSNIYITEQGSTTPITVWTGDAASVTLVPVNTENNNAIVSITVYYGDMIYTPEPEPETPEFTVAEALEYLADGNSGTAIVSGIVSQVTNFNSNYGSITYYIVDDLEDEDALQIYGGLGLDGAKFTALTDLPVGSKVQVKGSLKNYTNSAGETNPEMDLNSVILTLVFPDDYVEPEIPAAPEGVLSVKEAVEDYIMKGYTGNAIVKGVISKVTNFYENYGQIDYYITDANGTVEMMVYQGLGLNGDKFTSLDNLEVGAEVEIEGNIKLYNATPEFDRNSKILKYTAPTTGGEGEGGEGGEGEGGGTTGINSINADLSNAQIFTLQGVRVNNPAKGGIYIIRQGDKTYKMVIR
ncbi:MAG: hypothetical protein J1F12_00465 [Muribaculaceae bacterium]|nr:hypothetical protein [Muribaculaceae bacterium]